MPSSWQKERSPLIRLSKSLRPSGVLTVSPASQPSEDEVESQIQDELAGDGEIHGLNEARAVYSDGKLPDFVIRQPGDSLTRQVVFRPCKGRDGALIDGKLRFEFWDEERKQGFWTLTDDEGFDWIVKYFAKGNEYRAWLGAEIGYDRSGLAFVRKRPHGGDAQNVASQSPVSEYNDESAGGQLNTGRTFRKRTIDQIHPYSTERSNYMRSKSGTKTLDYKRQDLSEEGPSVRAVRTKERARRASSVRRSPQPSRPPPERSTALAKPRLSLDRIEGKVTPAPTSDGVSVERIREHTTLYIFTNSDFDAAPGTVYLRSCRDVDSFFSTMAFVAGADEEDDVRQITVRFDWVPDSKPKTIRMLRGIADSYDKMIEEIREAPDGGPVAMEEPVSLSM